MYHGIASGEVLYYQVDQMDAQGRVVEATLGNGKTIFNTYDPTRGQLTRIRAGDASPTLGTVQDLELTYDLVAEPSGN